MTYNILMQEVEGISEDLMQEVIRFIRFLKTEISQGNSKEASTSGIRFDVFKGGLDFISDDFDSSLETFEEYV